MPRSSWACSTLLCLVLGAACAPALTGRPATPPAPPPAGATLLAHPVARVAFTVAGDRREVVVGRVRYHLDEDGGATRVRTVVDPPVQAAMAVPSFLGGGLLLVGNDVMYRAREGAVVPLVRGPLTGPSFGAKGVIARARTTLDWVSIPFGQPASYVPPPIAAPVLPVLPPSVAWADEGRPSTPGPELNNESFGVALVAVLGPVITHDGGSTFTPLVGRPPGFWPTRLTRDGTGTLLLVDDARAVPLSANGALGQPYALPTKPVPPRVTPLALEQAIVDGVALEDGRVLYQEGNRLAVVQREPLRVLRVSDLPEVVGCSGLRKAKPPSLAVAVCRRIHESKGDQVVVGTIEDGSTGPRLVVELIFPSGTGVRLSASGAVVVAGNCKGHTDNENLHTAQRLCVRDAKGGYHDVSLSTTVVGERIAEIPDEDGGLTFLRSTVDKGLTLVRPDGQLLAQVLAFEKGQPRPEVLAADSLPDGRLVVWTKTATKLTSIVVERATGVVVRHASALPNGVSVGVFGAEAVVAQAPDGLVSAVGSRDVGQTFAPLSFGPDPRALDRSASGRRVECGPLGCRLFGWTRLGFEPALASHDTVVSADAAPTLPKLPDAPKRATRLRATCTALGPETLVDAASVPVASAFGSSRDALLGGPEPKVVKGQTLALLPFVRGSVRGGFVTVGPAQPAPFGDGARTVARFATDFDPVGTAHETMAGPAPFQDAYAATQSGLYAYALAPGRALVAHCTYGGCALHRLVAGAPIETLPAPPGLLVRSVSNARELGGALLVVGVALRDKPPVAGVYEAATGFAATRVGGVWSVLTFAAPGNDELVGTTDATHGRFGLFLSSKVPTFLGGSAFVLPIDANAQPGSGFEPLAGSVAELLRASTACPPTLAAWDRGDTMLRDRPVEIVVDGVSEGTLATDTGVLRTRIHGKGACLERLTAVAPTGTLQWDASTGRATLLRPAVPPTKTASRRALSCSLEFRD